MKTYKTWEAIKMLTENKKLEFDWYNDFGGTGRLRRDIEVVDAANCYDENGDEINIGLDEKWTLVQQPVSFMEAIRSGKELKVEHEYIDDFKDNCIGLKDYEPLRVLIKFFTLHFTSKEIKEVILNGIWYIKEDEE